MRRIELKATGAVYSLCPSFVMLYLSGFTKDVKDALFLSSFGVRALLGLEPRIGSR